MSKITPRCNGCKWLTECLAPQCKTCVDNDNYELRTHNFGVEKELQYITTASGSGNELLKRMRLNSVYGAKGNYGFPMKYALDYSDGEDYTAAIKYWKADVESTYQLMRDVYGKGNAMYLPRIEKVIFNDPATIIVWKDGTKTVVKAENETFDPEKGLAMAIAKKALGNQGNYYEVFKKWLPK